MTHCKQKRPYTVCLTNDSTIANQLHWFALSCIGTLNSMLTQCNGKADKNGQQDQWIDPSGLSNHKS